MSGSATFAKPDRETTLIALVAIVVIAGLLATAAVFLGEGTDDAAAAVVEPGEFVASYGATLLPSGVLHNVELTAAETTTAVGAYSADRRVVV